jgi:hypothetical protein
MHRQRLTTQRTTSIELNSDHRIRYVRARLVRPRVSNLSVPPRPPRRFATSPHPLP